MIAATSFYSCSSDPVPRINLEQFMYISLSGAKENPSIKLLDLGSARDTLFNLSIAYGGTTDYEQGAITAEIAADKSLVDAFNAEHSTGYLPLPDATFSFDKTSLTIANGSNISDIARLSIHMNVINLAYEYILPVSVKSINSSKLPLNDELKTIYLVFQGDVDENPDQQNWISLDASSVWQTGFEVANAFDDDPDTYWHTDLTGLPQWFSVDMKGYKRISGFTWRNRRDYDQRSIPRHVKIETSMNGITWSEALDTYTPSLNIPEMPQSRVLQVFPLTGTVLARYFKVSVLSSWTGDPYTYVAEVGIYSGDAPDAEYDWEKPLWTVLSRSSEWSNTSWAASNTIDGDKNTTWHTEPFDAAVNGMPQWFIIDMQKQRPLKGVKLWNRQEDHGNEPKNILFELSDDQITWRTALNEPEMSNAYTEELDLPFPDVATGRYLRVTVKTNWAGGAWTYIAELTPY
jgi:hypothetical protein